MVSHTLGAQLLCLCKGVGWMGVSVAFCEGIFLAGVSVLCGLERVWVIFTSYVSKGRCMIMENFTPPCLHRGFVCGQIIMIKSSVPNTRGHKVAKNST